MWGKVSLSKESTQWQGPGLEQQSSDVKSNELQRSHYTNMLKAKSQENLPGSILTETNWQSLFASSCFVVPWLWNSVSSVSSDDVSLLASEMNLCREIASLNNKKKSSSTLTCDTVGLTAEMSVMHSNFQQLPLKVFSIT